MSLSPSRAPKKKGISEQLTGAEISHLLTGQYRSGTDVRWMQGLPNWQLMIQIWELVQGEFLPGWIRDHPGTRPFAWWVCDAPERMKRPDGQVVEKLIAPPGYWVAKFEAAAFESQAEYLLRLDLMDASEKKIVLNQDIVSRQMQDNVDCNLLRHKKTPGPGPDIETLREQYRNQNENID